MHVTFRVDGGDCSQPRAPCGLVRSMAGLPSPRGAEQQTANDISARKRILRRRAAAKAVELPTTYPAPPICRLRRPATRIGTSASEASPMMQMKMQYLCLSKGIGSIHDASLAPPDPGQARSGESQGRPSNGVVDTRA
jgi:hypothetical protein